LVGLFAEVAPTLFTESLFAAVVGVEVVTVEAAGVAATVELAEVAG
jgi:hypothetical protein